VSATLKEKEGELAELESILLSINKHKGSPDQVYLSKKSSFNPFNLQEDMRDKTGGADSFSPEAQQIFTGSKRLGIAGIDGTISIDKLSPAISPLSRIQSKANSTAQKGGEL